MRDILVVLCDAVIALAIVVSAAIVVRMLIGSLSPEAAAIWAVFRAGS